MSAGKANPQRDANVQLVFIAKQRSLIAEQRHVCSQWEQQPGGTNLKRGTAGPRSEECLSFPCSTLAKVRDTTSQPANHFVEQIEKQRQWSSGSLIQQEEIYAVEYVQSHVECSFLLLFFLTVCFTVPLALYRSGARVSQCGPRLWFPPPSSCCKHSA